MHEAISSGARVEKPGFAWEQETTILAREVQAGGVLSSPPEVAVVPAPPPPPVGVAPPPAPPQMSPSPAQKVATTLFTTHRVSKTVRSSQELHRSRSYSYTLSSSLGSYPRCNSRSCYRRDQAQWSSSNRDTLPG